MNKIALLIGYLNIGGAEKLVLDLAINLKKNNRDVIIITIKGLGDLEEEVLKNNIPIYNLNSKSKFSFFTIKKLVDIINENNIDILHSHSFNAHVYSVIASKICNTRHIHTEHNVVDNKLKYQIFLDKILLRYTDKIVACSKFVYINLEKYYSNNKLVFVNNGIDTERFKFDSKARNATRKALKIDDDELVMITVAMLRPQKNHVEFLKVASEIFEKNRKIKWIIVGDGPCKEEIEDKIKLYNIQSNIIMIGSNNHVSDLLSAADLFILPSKYEGLPLSILESMSCEVPVIATDVGGVGQVVIDNVNGYKIMSNNLNEFINIVLTLRTNRLKLNGLKKTCREFIVNNYSIEQCYNNYDKIYTSSKM